MRRSAHVFAPLLAATAVAVTGWHHAEPQRCVDEANHVVEPKFCANLPPGSQQPLGGNTTNGGIFYPHMYRYYYGGLGGYALGSLIPDVDKYLLPIMTKKAKTGKTLYTLSLFISATPVS